MEAKDLKKIIEDCAKMKYEITVRDISYIVLFNEYNSSTIAYKSIFGDGEEDVISKYHKSKTIKFLKTYIDANFKNKKQTKNVDEEDIQAEYEDITFEENKEAMVRLLAKIPEAIKNGMSIKDALKLEADVRTRLNDKFSVAEKVEQQYIIVEQKYDDICPYCRHEIAVPTKEVLMQKYNLIENTNKNA